MAINRSSFSAQPISQNYDVTIQMLGSRPDTREDISPAVSPNVMYGYYDDVYDLVELYVTSWDGTRYIKIA